MSFDKETQLKKIEAGQSPGLALVKKRPSDAIELVKAKPRDPYDVRVVERAELALASGQLNGKDRRDLDALLRAKYGKRIGFEADELSPEEEEQVFPAAVVAFMSGVCEYVGSDFHPEYLNLVETIGDGLRDHKSLSKITIEELVFAKRDLAKIPREDLPTAFHNRLDPSEFISVLEKWWAIVRGKTLGRIGGKLREEFRTEEDLNEEASRRELEDRQIAAAQVGVNAPTFRQHLSAKATLEEVWATLVKRYKEDEAFQSRYVQEIPRILLDDLDPVARYIDDCFPRLFPKYEQRAAELAFRQLKLNETNPGITPDLLEKIGKVANRIRLAFHIWNWLKEGHHKFPPEPIVKG